MTEEALGLRGVERLALKGEWRIESAPAEYRPIGPVAEVQVRAGMVKLMAGPRPLVTIMG